MKIIISLLFIIFLACPSTYAQQHMVKNGEANTDSFVFNQRDGLGQPTGLWYRFNAQHLGEEAFFDFGYYRAGARNGKWYKISEDGELISIETYRNNVRHGEAKYFDKGKLLVIGQYRGYNSDVKLDTVLVVDPVTQYETLKVVHKDQGSTKHGTWKYFNVRNGKLIREEEWQVDEIIARKNYGFSSVDSTLLQKRIDELPHAKHNKVHHHSGTRLIEGD